CLRHRTLYILFPYTTLFRSESQLEGRLINGTAIRIASSFTLRPALYSATYPAGLYFPQFQDEDGVYFRAERPIVGQTIAGGTTRSEEHTSELQSREKHV